MNGRICARVVPLIKIAVFLKNSDCIKKFSVVSSQIMSFVRSMISTSRINRRSSGLGIPGRQS